MFYTVYLTTNVENGKVYVGAHKTADLDDGYLGSGTAIRKAINKYGIEAFEKTILHVFDNEDDMWEMEKQIVDHDFVSLRETYNMRIGGLAGKPPAGPRKGWSIEARKKFSDQCTGRYFSQESKDKVSKNNRGKVRTSETRKRMSEAAKKRAPRKFSDQAKENMKRSKVNRIWIHDLSGKTKNVPAGQLDQFLSDGWMRGRK